MSDKITYKIYLKGLKTFWGALAGIFALEPLATFLPQDYTKYIVPPLDDQFLVWACVICLLLILSFFYFKDARSIAKQRRTKFVIVLLCIACIGLITYMLWSHQVVRSTEIRGDRVSIVIGLARTDFAKTTFPGMSDEEMLNSRTWSSQAVRELWGNSVLIAEGILLLSYLLMLIPLVSLLSACVLFDVVDSQP